MRENAEENLFGIGSNKKRIPNHSQWHEVLF